MNKNEIDTRFECAICQYILTNPYQNTKCSHIFCKGCLDSLICPLCQINFTNKDLKEDKILNSEIKSTNSNCYCNQIIKLSEWNDHINNCKVYLDQYHNDISKSVVKNAKESVNRSTFKCSICSERNLDREALLKHIGKYHKNDEAVCPICICQPWGDPNYLTHLNGHLNKRHKFDYDTTVDYNDDEDEILKRVMMESMNTK